MYTSQSSILFNDLFIKTPIFAKENIYVIEKCIPTNGNSIEVHLKANLWQYICASYNYLFSILESLFARNLNFVYKG